MDTNLEPPFYYLVPVWGKEYVKNFLEVSLLSQLSPNNFSKKNYDAKSKYLVYTLPEHQEEIQNNLAFRLLSTFITTEFVLFDATSQNAHSKMSWCHNHGIRIAERIDAACVFWAPDFLYADGTIPAMRKILNQGKRVIFTVGIRTILESISKAALEIKKNDRICLTTRELASLSLDHLHQIAYNSFWPPKDSSNFIPANIFWPVNKEGLICHAFHLHPLLVYPKIKGISIKVTVDDDYILKACPENEEHYIVQDSDELYLCELSYKDRMLPTGVNFKSLNSLNEWITYNTNQQHREMVNVPICIHRGKKDLDEWKRSGKNSTHVIDSTLKALYSSEANKEKEKTLRYLVENTIQKLKIKVNQDRPVILKIRQKIFGSLKKPTIGNYFWSFWKHSFFPVQEHLKDGILVVTDENSPYSYKDICEELEVNTESNVSYSKKNQLSESLIVEFGNASFPPNIVQKIIKEISETFPGRNKIVILATGNLNFIRDKIEGLHLVSITKTGRAGGYMAFHFLYWLRSQYKTVFHPLSKSRVLSFVLSPLTWCLCASINLLSIVIDKIDRTDVFSRWCLIFLRDDND